MSSEDAVVEAPVVLGVDLRRFVRPEEVDETLREALAVCWADVSDAGGAVGFVDPPVDREQVAALTREFIETLDPGYAVLFVALAKTAEGERVAGWVAMTRDRSPITAHWGYVRRLQSHPDFRGFRIGERLLEALTDYGRELGLRQFHLTARGGLGLEGYYERLGWREVGRWPRGLRVGPDDYRDEIMMQRVF